MKRIRGSNNGDPPSKRTRSNYIKKENSESKGTGEKRPEGKGPGGREIEISETQEVPRIPKLGDRVSILWQKHRSGPEYRWYSGRVIEKLSYSEDYIVKYDDGETHNHAFNSQEWKFLDDDNDDICEVFLTECSVCKELGKLDTNHDEINCEDFLIKKKEEVKGSISSVNIEMDELLKDFKADINKKDQNIEESKIINEKIRGLEKTILYWKDKLVSIENENEGIEQKIKNVDVCNNKLNSLSKELQRVGIKIKMIELEKEFNKLNQGNV